MPAAERPTEQAGTVRIARVYEEPKGRGHRVLVDRLWPRGVAKAELELDDWPKDVAPSTELRRWFRHDPARFEEFTRRYTDELRRPPAADAAEALAATARRGPLVLLTATKDVDHSGARVLADHLAAMVRAG